MSSRSFIVIGFGSKTKMHVHGHAKSLFLAASESQQMISYRSSSGIASFADMYSNTKSKDQLKVIGGHRFQCQLKAHM